MCLNIVSHKSSLMTDDCVVRCQCKLIYYAQKITGIVMPYVMHDSDVDFLVARNLLSNNKIL